MLQIGIRAHDVEHRDVVSLVENIAGKGFSCTQLALSKAITEFQTDIGAMTPGMALYLKRLFAKNNVDISVLGCYMNLGENDESAFNDVKKIYEAHIRFASLLGCGMVGTETWGGTFEPKSEEALEVLIKNMKQIVGYAEKMGVIIGMEMVASHIVYDAKRARKVLDEVNSPNLQIIFDPVNIITQENYEKQGEIINEVFDLVGDEIVCIHAKDFIVDKEGEIKSVISGDGLLDYNLLLRILKKRKPLIHVLLEETNEDNVLYAKEYIEKIIEKV